MTNPAIPKPVLDAETAVFIQRYVAVNLATTNAANRAAVTRVYGCRVAEDLSNITLFIASNCNQSVLDNIKANGVIAVVFTRPVTHQTIQFKSTDARLAAVKETDHPLIQAYCDSLIEELQRAGFPPAFTRAMIPPLEKLDTAICFTPMTAFSQTPGPQAGKKLPV
jgi:hypothetical protein